MLAPEKNRNHALAIAVNINFFSGHSELYTTHFRSPYKPIRIDRCGKDTKRTLNMTRSLPCKTLYNSAARIFMSQYGQGVVQNPAMPSALAARPPRGVSMGTDREKMPCSIYTFHRVTICSKCSRLSVVSGERGKKDGFKREIMVSPKSKGVTSDTNQGISFGLVECRCDDNKKDGIHLTGKRLSTHEGCKLLESRRTLDL